MKTFETFDDIIKDDRFNRFVKTNLDKFITARLGRPAAKKGFKYKRDWYDKMSSNGTLNTTFFINNVKSIWERKSSLSSEARNVIQSICYVAYLEMITYYKEQDEAKRV